MNMEYRGNFITWLAIASLLLAGPLFAAENESETDAEAATQSAQAASRELANEATRSAADAAASSVQEQAKLDLDIRLIGPTSVTIASKR